MTRFSLQYKRFLLRYPVALRLIFSYLITLIFRTKIKSDGVNYERATLYIIKEVLKFGDIGKSSAKRLSLPISSELNTPYGYTAYSYYMRNSIGIELLCEPRVEHLNKSLKNKFISLIGQYLILWAELAVKRGFYKHGYTIYRWMSSNRRTSWRLLGYIGLLDLSVLLYKWRRQLEPYKKSGAWFNSDKLSLLPDDISFISKELNVECIQEIYHSVTSLDCKSIAVYMIYADYLKSRNRVYDALGIYEKANVLFPNSRFIQSELNHLVLMKEGGDNSKYQRYALINTREIENIETFDLGDDDEEQVSIVNYDFYCQGRHYVNNALKLPVELRKGYKLQSAFEMKTSVGCFRDSKKLIIGDSSPLQGAESLMFNRYSLIQDNNYSLSLIQNYCHSGEAYFIPHNGWSYYHWLIEVIPLLLDYKSLNRKSLPIFFNFELQSWHYETLILLGLDDVNILPVLPNMRRSFDSLYTSFLTGKNILSPIASIQRVRKVIASPKNIKRGKRVYLTRPKNVGIRTLINERECFSLLADYGFTELDPSSMSIREQIEYFSDVEAIVAEGGAALSNLIFCPEKTKALCLTSERCFYLSFSSIAAACKQQLSYAVSPSRVIPSPYFMWCSRVFVPDVRNIKTWLEEHF